jgi:pimeloyl-ACP methyl ester carboxylesterase
LHARSGGDAHLKNFSVLYRHAEDIVELAPAYDFVSTQVYQPRDTLALSLRGSKTFPPREELIRFVRHVTGKAQQSAVMFGDLRRTGRDNDIEQWSSLGIDDWSLEKITAPTLIVHGTADIDAPYEGSAKASARIPNTKLVTIEGGDHLIIVSRAKEILDHVQRFANAHSTLDPTK